MNTTVLRRRLEEQGFCNLDQEALTELGPWLRWSPAICAVVILIGTLLQSPMILWALAITAALGTALPNHPFDYLYNYGVRHVTGTRPFPPQGPQRRFACGLATVWLIGTGWVFHEGSDVAGYVLGGLLFAVSAIVSTTHFCIPSLIYNTLFSQRATSA
jgi:hypothetical protein